MPSIASERATVENPLVAYVREIGWGYLPQDQALTLRRGESGTLFYQTLRHKLISLNPGVVTVSNVDEVIARIESVRNNIEGNVPKFWRGFAANGPFTSSRKSASATWS